MERASLSILMMNCMGSRVDGFFSGRVDEKI